MKKSTKELSDYILKCQESKKMTYSEILKDINEKGWKTITNRKLTFANLRNIAAMAKKVSRASEGGPPILGLIEKILDQGGMSAEAKISLINEVRKNSS